MIRRLANDHALPQVLTLWASPRLKIETIENIQKYCDIILLKHLRKSTDEVRKSFLSQQYLILKLVHTLFCLIL